MIDFINYFSAICGLPHGASQCFNFKDNQSEDKMEQKTIYTLDKKKIQNTKGKKLNTKFTNLFEENFQVLLKNTTTDFEGI